MAFFLNLFVCFFIYCLFPKVDDCQSDISDSKLFVVLLLLFVIHDSVMFSVSISKRGLGGASSSVSTPTSSVQSVGKPKVSWYERQLWVGF